MKIGFDVDGVLALFTPTYHKLVVGTSGRNLFEPDDDKNPPCWNTPELRGYTKKEMSGVWSAITSSRDFWLHLPETPDSSTLRMCILDLQRFHDIYFVTNRPGIDSKWQTEQWLMLHLGIERPTVLISSMKGLVAKSLKFDCYLDDNLDNANDVVLMTLATDRPVGVEGPTTRTYLLNKSYNQDRLCDSRVTLVDTLGQFLDKELIHL